MAIVSETLDLPGGSTPPGVTVTVTLAGEGGFPLPVAYGSVAGTTIVGNHTVTPDANGVWTVDLPRNDQITPAGTAWKVVLSGGGVSSARYIDVDGAGPFDVSDILTDPPASIDSSTYAALEARIDLLETYAVTEGDA